MRDRLIGLQVAIVRRPHRVAFATAALTLLALWAGTRVEFRTSRAELAPPDDPDQQRMSELLAQNAGTEALIACVEGEEGSAKDVAALRSFVDRLAEEFSADPAVEGVYYRIDLDWFLERGLYLVPPEALRKVADAFSGRGDLVGALAGMTDLAAFNDLLADWLEAGRAGGLSSVDPAEAARGVAVIATLLEAQQALLEDPAAALARVESGAVLTPVVGARARSLGSGGYVATRDGETLFLVITPRITDDSLPFRRTFVRAMRERADTVRRLQPGFRVAFTGQPATVVEEMNTVRRDTWMTSVFAVLGVTLLTMLVFRWRAHAFLVLAALFVGVALSFGAVLLEFGYLNMITSSFISTLIGVGVAYGIHPVSEYELEGAHTEDPERTILTSFRRTGAGVTVAAITTSVAFLSIRWMRFRGFAELGVVAGVGVLLCLAAAILALPAFLMLYARRRRRRVAEGGRRAAVVDRVWVELAADRICAFPRVVTATAVLLTLVAGWAAAGLSFSTNILRLLPRGAESVRYQERMMLHSDLAPFYNIVVAADLDGLAEMRAAAEREPTISRFESPLDFLPRDVAASSAAIERLRPLLSPLQLPRTARPVDAETLEAALRRVEGALAAATDDAFGAGLADLVEPLERARAAAEGGAATAAGAAADLVRGWNVAQQRLLDLGNRALDRLHRGLDLGPPTPDNLPAELRARFFTRSGEMLALLHPAGEVFDREELARFVAASRRVSPEATGFPLVFHKMSRRITSGFVRAVAFGALLVSLVLWIDFRKLRDAGLALVPLAMGVVWMMGGMRLLDIPFNFANLVAVPLIIGVGIDNGVHVIHRVRLEGREGMHVVLRHTGRAILIASLTTMIGFGSLALADHQGIASLGLVLLLGVGSCLVASTVVLPNLLVCLGWVNR